MQEHFFADYLERLEDLQRRLHAEIQELPAEAIDWVPGEGMNSVAVLLTHTAGSLRYWIGDMALDDPSGRVRQREFQTQGLPGAELLRRLDEVFEYASSNLPRLRLEELEKEHRSQGYGVVTCGWALLHALEHSYLHLGHVQITCQLWKQSGRPD